MPPKPGLPVVHHEQLANNLGGDLHGLPGYTFNHFLDEQFALSASMDVLHGVESTYPPGDLSVVALCGGEAFYERIMCRSLSQDGYRPDLTVYDLQQASLDRLAATNTEDFPVHPVHADVTDLPLPNGEDRPTVDGRPPRLLLLSRAFEHYLPESAQISALQEVTRVLRPGELYAAQLSSGDPGTLRLLEAAVKAVAGKKVHYQTVDDYVEKVDKASSGLLVVESVGHAETQRGRGVLQQAMRYLNPAFLKLHNKDIPPDLRDSYLAETQALCQRRDEIDLSARLGNISRREAIHQYGEILKSSRIYPFFRAVYLDAMTTALNNLETPPNKNTTVVREGGEIVDVRLDVEYPIVMLRRVESVDDRDDVIRRAASLAVRFHDGTKYVG